MAAWLKGWFGGAPKADAAPKIPAPVAGGKETFDAGGVAPELVGAARWEAIRAAWNVKTSEPKPRRRQDIDVDGISYVWIEVRGTRRPRHSMCLLLHRTHTHTSHRR
eukprot:TRINITY_DN2043_c0_g1_i1.p2 TRINITY_DN2043_c0_g1~~TRINITY_DN2043_c0_g1_i1.p2  ORF type:complete len:107 (+),score=10.37 TRINITY_DN2043_c0_g1_i1:57-377(+)